MNRDTTDSAERPPGSRQVHLAGPSAVLGDVAAALERDGAAVTGVDGADPTAAAIASDADCVVVAPGTDEDPDALLDALPPATPVVWYDVDVPVGGAAGDGAADVGAAGDGAADDGPAGVRTAAVDGYVRRRDDGSDPERVVDQVRWATGRSGAAAADGPTVDGPTADGPVDDGFDGKIRQLHRAATEMVACRDEHEVLELALETAEEILAFDMCGIDVVEDGWLVPVVVTDEMAEVGYKRSTLEDAGIAGEAVRTGETFVDDDIHEMEDAEPADDVYRSGMTIPIGELGVFQATSREVAAFDETDRELAELLIAYTRETVKRIRLEAQLRDRRETIERLHEVATELVACDDEAALFDRLVAAAAEVLEFEVSVVLTTDDDALVIRATSESDLAPAVGGRVQPGEGLVGETYRTGQSTLVRQVDDHDVADPAQEAYQSGISLPLGDDGVFQAIATEPAAFDEADLELAELLVSQAAEALARIRAEAQLRDERDRLAALFENVPDPAASVALEADRTVVEDVNPAFEAVFGYDAEAAAGRDIDELIVPPSAADEAREINERFRAGESLHVESERVTADGETRDFLLHVVPLERSEGNLLGYVIYTDITDRKRRERQLNALHATTRQLMTAGDRTAVCEAVVEAASDVLGLPFSGVHLRADDGEGLAPVAVSPAAHELFDGEPPTYSRGGDIWSLFEDGDRLAVGDIDPEYVDPDAPVDRAMIVPLGDHGVFLSAAGDGTEFDDGTRELARLLAANTEVALDRMERERELARQNERLDEFASVVSHDLRNPLNVARGFAEIARDTGEADAFDRVEAAHDRMEALIEGLLALAREGSVVGDDEPVGLAGAAERAWASVDAPDAELAVARRGAIRADPDRLVQLLENLFRNAVEHGSTSSRPSDDDAPPEITVGTLPGDGSEDGGPEREAAPAGFYVADDGPGIPEPARDEVLEAGYSTSDDGTGFGLAIVKRIAEAHGWSVTVTESDAGGARFEFRT